MWQSRASGTIPVAAAPDHPGRWAERRQSTRRSRRVAVMADEPAVRFLRGILTLLRSQPWEGDYLDITRARPARDEARARFATILAPELVGGTDRGTLLALVRDVNRHHGTGTGRGIPADLDATRLREALVILVDERLPLADRLDRLRPPGGVAMVKGFGPSAITSVLHLIDPDRYGILNANSQSVLRRLGIHPEVPASASLAVRYEAVNRVLLRLASALEIDLGMLDHLFRRVQPRALSDFAAKHAQDR